MQNADCLVDSLVSTAAAPVDSVTVGTENRSVGGSIPPLGTKVYPMRISAMLERYETEILPTKKSRTDAYVTKRLKADPFTQQDIESLKVSDIAAYRDRRVLESGPRCALYDLQVLSHCTTVAMSEWDLVLPNNPFKVVRKPKQNPARERRLSDEESQCLFSALSTARNPRLLPMVQLAILTAMRKGELLNLRWPNINWVGSYAVIVGKTGKRTVPLSREAMEVLRTLHPMTGSFSCRRVLGMTENGFKMSWARLKKKAGLVDFHFHDLRHESISRYMERGDLTLQEVATISGHKTLNMLWRYTHLKTSALASKL